MTTTYYIACDLGAESGRVMEGSLNNGKLMLSELQRFSNQPIKDKDSLYWDIPKMPINTVVQLGSEKANRLGKALQLLSVADGFNFLLSGAAKFEVSMASTTQLYNPITRNWSDKLIQALRLPPKLLPPIVPS